MLIALKCASLTLLEPHGLSRDCCTFYIHACIHSYLPTYLPTYLHACLPAHPPSTPYIHICSENCFIHNWSIRESWLTSKLTEVKLYQVMEGQRGSRGIALLFLNLGTRWGRWLTPGSVNTARYSAFTCRVHMAVKF